MDQDNVTIRFFTDNVGPWFFHCHIDWHLDASVVFLKKYFPASSDCGPLLYRAFAVVFATDIPNTVGQIEPPGELCAFFL